MITAAHCPLDGVKLMVRDRESELVTMLPCPMCTREWVFLEQGSMLQVMPRFAVDAIRSYMAAWEKPAPEDLLPPAPEAPR